MVETSILLLYFCIFVRNQSIQIHQIVQSVEIIPDVAYDSLEILSSTIQPVNPKVNSNFVLILLKAHCVALGPSKNVNPVFMRQSVLL